ncbi:hypothetical protein CALVIDRAFT_499897 [Calocera viscosa TUFC12733]|uniref:CCHC-type domain-containing protein n=1 Tax=Calocera viscosa (strain TUFC12733) TaxID=1330018 RepID=A0A167LD82_CALVF|nr:hypothetical protein CALVIDRAFT_499897 [Calocera viscosa TUFC12733]
MTRYTNLGYKRTHVEATNLDGAPAALGDGGAATAGAEGGAEEPKKKKTHRAGKKFSKKRKREDGAGDDGGDKGGEESGPAGGGEEADGERPIKKRRTGGQAPEVGTGPPVTNIESGAVPASDAADAAAALAPGLATGSKQKAKPKKKFERKKFEKDAKARALASEQRRLARIGERQSGTVCFACRQTGHSIRDCPNASTTADSARPGKVALKGETLCYRCGSTGHTLARCRKPAPPGGELPFAKCFVCGGTGHLAGQCGQNARGVYPRGGSCKLCGEVTHLAKDCVLNTRDTQGDALVLGMSTEGGGDEDDFHVLKRRKAEVDKDQSTTQKPGGTPATKPKKIIKF